MIFKPDSSKQAQEVIFSRKIKKLLHPTLLVNSETPWFNIRCKVKLLKTYKEYYQKKIVKLWVFYVNFNKFCQGDLFSLYIKLL